MREIKFRAWDENRKIMHNNFQFIKSGDEGNDWLIPIKPLSDVNWIKTLSEESIRSAPHFRKQFHIMQFTGLHDKNGGEVFEGDIVKCVEEESPHRWEKFTVIFSGCSFQYKPMGARQHTFSPVGCEVVVIGNIHENGELLK